MALQYSTNRKGAKTLLLDGFMYIIDRTLLIDKLQSKSNSGVRNKSNAKHEFT